MKIVKMLKDFLTTWERKKFTFQQKNFKTKLKNF